MSSDVYGMMAKFSGRRVIFTWWTVLSLVQMQEHAVPQSTPSYHSSWIPFFTKVEALVGVGGRYAGYVPIIQGDNAGPHQEGDFDASCKA
jgi:hypothetical protein